MRVPQALEQQGKEERKCQRREKNVREWALALFFSLSLYLSLSLLLSHSHKDWAKEKNLQRGIQLSL